MIGWDAGVTAKPIEGATIDLLSAHCINIVTLSGNI